MADALDLIALDRATVCLWPVSETDPRLHLRIVAGDPTEAQRAWVARRRGRITIADSTGAGDASALYQATGRDPGWADAGELRREFGKLDCPLGASMRTLAKQLGDAA